MKQIHRKGLCCLLAALMLLALAPWGKAGAAATSDLLELEDCQLQYKGACIMEGADGKDAMVLTLDFTNTSKQDAAYFWTVIETGIQNGTALEAATVYVDYASWESVVDSQLVNAAPGETVQVQIAFTLLSTDASVEVVFQQLIGTKEVQLHLSPLTLSRETAANADAPDALLSWWNGSWYGWWTMTDCTGSYQNMEGQWWDICGTIAVDEDCTGTLTLWDEDYTQASPTALVPIRLDAAGAGEHGTMTSQGGWFTDMSLDSGAWVSDPGLLDYPQLIHIAGDYEMEDNTYHYDIYLRPWGVYWDDMDEAALPYLYHDWYLPMIASGSAMPGSIGQTPET